MAKRKNYKRKKLKKPKKFLFLIIVILFVILFSAGIYSLLVNEEAKPLGLIVHYYNEGKEVTGLFQQTWLSPLGGYYDEISFDVYGTNTGTIDVTGIEVIDAFPQELEDALLIYGNTISTELKVGETNKLLYESNIIDISQFSGQTINFFVDVSGYDATNQLVDNNGTISETITFHVVEPEPYTSPEVSRPSFFGMFYNSWTFQQNGYITDDAYEILPEFDSECGQEYFWFNFNIPAGAYIKGIKLEVEGNDAVSDVWSGRLAGIQGVLKWNEGTSATELKHAEDLWSTDKVYTLGSEIDTWGREWTAEEINSEFFRIDLSTTYNRKGTGYIDDIVVSIYYTLDTAYPIFYEDFNNWAYKTTGTIMPLLNCNDIGQFNGCNNNGEYEGGTANPTDDFLGTTVSGYYLLIEGWNTFDSTKGIWYSFNPSTACGGSRCDYIELTYYLASDGLDADDYVVILGADDSFDNVELMRCGLGDSPCPDYSYSTNNSPFVSQIIDLSAYLDDGDNNWNISIGGKFDSGADSVYFDNFKIVGYK